MARLPSRPAPLSAVSDSLCASVVAAEDRRFLWHVGADPWGVARAALTLGRGGGGSSLTQQARRTMEKVRSILLSPPPHNLPTTLPKPTRTTQPRL